MKTILFSTMLLTALFSNANTLQKVVNLNCSSPKTIAGGISLNISGQVEIVKSPTTGMLRVAEGTLLRLTTGATSRLIPYQGVYNGYPYVKNGDEHIDGTYDSDDRDYTSIKLYLKDNPNATRSFVTKLNGQKIPLVCF